MISEEIEDTLILMPEMKQIDVNNSQIFEDDLERLIGGHRKIILDISHVVFMDSTGLGIVVKSLRNMNRMKGKMVICGLNPAIQVLFEMVRLSQIVSLYPDRSEALRALSD